MKLKRAFFLVIALVFLVSFTKAVSTVDNRNQTAQVGTALSGQSVTSLVLVHPTNGTDITELSNGTSINLDTLGVSQVKVRAETSPAIVGSVKFNLDQMAAVVKNTSPYVLGPSTLAPGSHTLVVAPYTQARARGTMGLGRTVSFTVEGSGSSSDPHDTDTPTPTTPTDPNTNLPTNPPTGESSPRGLGVLSFTLVNADTNQDIRKLVNNDTIDISAVGPNINIRANTTALPDLPGSVRFDINGSKLTENKWPFTFKAGSGTDDYLPWSYTLGQDYIVRADTFTLPRGRGPAGGSLAISFNVVNSGNQTPSNFEVPVNGSNNSGGGSNIEGVNANTVTLLAPSSPGTLTPGQTVDMTCNATVATGSVLNKVQFDWIKPGTNVNGTFYIAESLNMQYPAFFTEVHQVTVPSILNPGDQIRFRCLAYYNGTSTPLNTDAEPDDTFTIGQQTVGQTTSVSITTPTNNANVLSAQAFNITAAGAPTSDQISKVDFYYQDDLTQPVLLGSDLVGSSFSISHNFLGNRGYLCPKIFAKATLTNQLTLTSAPVGLVITDATATTPMITCEQAKTTIKITEPTPNAVFPAGTPITIKVQNTYATAPQKVVLVHAGGNVSQNIAQGLPPFTLTVVGTATTPPYNFTHTINTPGFYGPTTSTDVFKAYAYYGNGLVSLSNVPVKILPPVNLPTISSAQVVDADGAPLATLSASTALQVNIGSQGSGFGQAISIKANASTNPATGSVRFNLTGPSGFAAHTICENNAPHSLFGDSGSTYNTWPVPITLGGYSLTITPYVGTNCTGNAGTAFNTTFLTINNDDVTPPLAPTGVTTTYRSASQIKLSWNSSTTATSYKVYRNPTTTGFPANVGSALTFTDNAVTAGGSYAYSISATDSFGNESGVSAEENPPALSIIYAIGNDVLLTDTVSVKTAPDGTNQTPQQWADTGASIIGGPVYFGGAQYWQLNFPTNPDGWVSENSFELDAPGDTTAPIATITAPTANQILAAGTTSVNLLVTTNEASTCRWAVSDMAYSSMPNTFTGTGTTSHSYALLGLTNGTSYTRYVRCQDTAGNASTTSQSVTFSVATGTPPPTDPVVNTTCPATMPNLPNETRNAARLTVQLCAQVSESSGTITLKWATVVGRTPSSITISRKTESTSWASVSPQPVATATSWTDTNITAGTYYEYKVQMVVPVLTGQVTVDTPVYGYISSGIKVPQEVYRGRLILVVDNAKATGTNGSAPTSGPLMTQVTNLINELIGDKWIVTPVYVSSTATPASVRTLIKGYYDADAGDGNSTTNTKAVYLFGHVPVPVIGNFNPDGHGSRGISSDQLYGEMTSTWNTGSVGSSVGYGVSGTFSMPSTHTYNNPSPNASELQVGRVDMYDLPGLPGTENEKLSAYLTKASNFKKRLYVPTDTMYIRARTPYVASGIPGWNSLSSIVGSQNITHDISQNETWSNLSQNHLYVHGYGQSGAYLSTSIVGQPLLCTIGCSMNNLSSSTWGGVFNVISASYVAEWNDKDSVLRAILADEGKGLTVAFGANNHWYYHQMGMGKNIGYSSLNSVNNTTSIYTPRGMTGLWNNADNGNNPYGYMTLLGDPTLRAHAVSMPTGILAMSNSGGNAAFSWGASTDSPLGYNIYEIQTNLIRKVNTSLIQSTSFVSTDAYSATKKYMVTAVKVRAGNSGTYYNESLGLISSLTGGQDPDTAAPSAPAGIVVSGTSTQTQIVLDWSDSTGDPVGEAIFYNVYRNSGGASAIGATPIASNLTTSTYTNTGLTAGTTYLYRVSSVDAAGNESALMPALPGFSAATQAAATAPVAPTNLTGSASSSSQINLSWIDNATNEATFTLERATNATFTTGLTTLSSTLAPDTTSYSATGLSASTTYYFRVKAVNATGSSAYATSSGVTTQATGGTGQVLGINGGVGPNNTENVTPGANPYGGTDYFISCSGNDSNNGTSASTPWLTIDKVNSTSKSAGMRFMFKRDCTYRGTIGISQSGTASAPIEFSAYGSGTAPVISGSTLLSGWTVYSGNIYKTTTTAGLTPKYLFVGGEYQTLARQPNTGFYMTDQRNATGITDTGNTWLSGLSGNALVGGDLVSRTSPWSWTRTKITASAASTISVASLAYGTNWSAQAGWGYLVQNKLSLLDTAGEWYYDTATGDVYLWAPGSVNPSTLTVEITTKDRGVSHGSGISDTKIKNLVIEQQNEHSIHISNGKRIVLENLSVGKSETGINNYTSSGRPASEGNIIRNNHVHDTNLEGVYTQGGAGHLIEGNVIERVSMSEDRMSNAASNWGHFGIYTTDSASNQTIRRNIIKDVGYIGLIATGSGLVTENYIENALVNMTDGGGIAFDFTDGMTISKNIVKDMYSDMTTMPTLYVGYIPLAKGIYFGDKDIKNTTIDANIIMDIESDAVWMDHGTEYIGNKVTNNIIHGFTRSGIGVSDWSNGIDFPGQCAPNNSSVCFVASYNDVVTGNKIYGLDSTQNPFYFLYSYSNGQGAKADFGTSNNNYFHNPYRTTKVQEVKNFVGTTSNYTLSQWQAASGEDANSTASNYTLTNANDAADIYYNATSAPIIQSVSGCNANGTPLTGAQTIQPFNALVVEHGNC